MMNNYQIGTRTINEIKRKGSRPSLLLHCCCAPCSTFPLKLLNETFDITLYFNNSNIYPFSEYDRRYQELIKYVYIFNNENNTSIKIIKTEYDESMQDFLGKRKDDPEKGPRCHLCFITRLKEAYNYANSNNYDYFTTVMTISRQKDEQIINRIGLVLEKQFFHNTEFLVHNFKRKGGQEERDRLVKEYNLYSQQYCGCKYSIRDKK